MGVKGQKWKLAMGKKADDLLKLGSFLNNRLTVATVLNMNETGPITNLKTVSTASGLSDFQWQ